MSENKFFGFVFKENFYIFVKYVLSECRTNKVFITNFINEYIDKLRRIKEKKYQNIRENIITCFPEET